MAIIKCNECGKDVSDKAERCVYCGAPIRKEKKDIKGKKRNVFIAIPVILVVIVILMGINVYSDNLKKKMFVGDWKTTSIESLHGYELDSSMELKITEDKKCYYSVNGKEHTDTWEYYDMDGDLIDYKMGVYLLQYNAKDDSLMGIMGNDVQSGDGLVYKFERE